MTSSVFADINDSLRQRVAKSGKVHDNYRAVFISWESDSDSSTEPGVEELASLLEGSFGFKSQNIIIPLLDSLSSLKRQLRIIIESEKARSCLWLIHYFGGAAADKGQLLWTSPSDKKCQIDFAGVLEAMAAVACDTVLLADCDYGVVPQIADNPLDSNDPASNKRLFEVLFSPPALPKDSPSFTKELFRVLDNLPDPRVNMISLRSKLVSLSTGGKTYAPCYAKLVKHAQSNLLEKVGATVDLRVALRRPLDDDVLDELKDWAQRKPPQIKRLIFEEGNEDTATIAEFILSVSAVNLDLLDAADWQKWIGSAPSSIETPRYNVQSSFSSRRLSKSTGNEEVESQLEAFVRRRNREESWRNHDSRLGHYSRVVVLPLIWEITGFSPKERIVEDLDELTKTCHEEFGFTVEKVFKIPVDQQVSGQDALEEKIRDLVDQTRGPNVLGAGDLLIVIYSGHGSDTVHSTGRAIWSSGSVPNGASPYRETVDWSHAQRHIDTAECDVAQILDCCHAATAAKTADDRGRNEIFAACVREQTTSTGPHCFCRIVAKVMKRMAKEGKPFSFRDLSRRVDQEARKMNLSGARNTIPTPYYKPLSEHMSSIMLRPRSASAFGSGSQRTMNALPNSMDRKVVAEVFVVLSLNGQLEEVKREHVTKNELLKRLDGGRM